MKTIDNITDTIRSTGRRRITLPAPTVITAEVRTDDEDFIDFSTMTMIVKKLRVRRNIFNKPVVLEAFGCPDCDFGLPSSYADRYCSWYCVTHMGAADIDEIIRAIGNGKH